MITSAHTGPAISRLRFQGNQPAPARQAEEAAAPAITAPPAAEPATPATSGNEIIDQLATMGYQLFDVPKSKEKDFLTALIGASQKAHLSGLSLFKKTQDPAKIDAGVRVIVRNAFSDLQQAGFQPAQKPELQTFLTKLIPTVHPKLMDFFQNQLVSLPSDGYAAGIRKKAVKSILTQTWAAVSADDKTKLQAQLKATMAKLFTPAAFQQTGQPPADFDAAYEKASAKWLTSLNNLVANPQQPEAVSHLTDQLIQGFVDSMAEGGFTPTRNLDVKQFVEDVAAVKLFILPKLYKALKEDARLSWTEKPLRMMAVRELDKQLSFITQVDPNVQLPPSPINLDELPVDKPRPTVVDNPPTPTGPQPRILGLPRKWAIEIGRFVATVAASVGITLGIVGHRAPQPAPVVQPPAIQRVEPAPVRPEQPKTEAPKQADNPNQTKGAQGKLPPAPSLHP